MNGDCRTPCQVQGLAPWRNMEEEEAKEELWTSDESLGIYQLISKSVNHLHKDFCLSQQQYQNAEASFFSNELPEPFES